MAAQNLVSAAISPEEKADILQKLSEIKETLSFLLSLMPEDIGKIMKAGNTYKQFIDKAYDAVTAHPEIMAGTFDLEEYKRDYALSEDILPIVNMVNELAESLENTSMAVNSDVMVGSLEVYAAVKANRKKVPGLNVVADELAEFFKKPRRK